MLKKLSIEIQIAITFSIGLAIVVGSLLYMSQAGLNSTIQTAEERELKSFFTNVQNSIALESRTAVMMSQLVANIPDVTTAMKLDDRDELNRMLVNSFKVLNEEFGVRQFQFHTPPATSFLRVHKPEKFGDDISSFRQTVVQANARREAIVGIEKGVVAGLGVRGVAPVFDKNDHIGSVEFGMSFGQPFFENFKRLYGIDLNLHVQKNQNFETFASTLNGATLLTTKQLENALSGSSVKIQSSNNDIPVAVYARTIQDFNGNPVGVLEIVMDRSQYASVLNKSVNTNMLIGLFSIIAGIVIAIFLGRVIARPITRVVAAMVNIAEGDGDLTRQLTASGSLEISELASAFNSFSEKVRGLVINVSGSTNQLAAAAEELSVITNDSNSNIAHQRSEIDQVATAMNEMTATVQEVARSAADAATAAKVADDEANQGRDVVKQVTDSIKSLAEEVTGAAEVIHRLRSDSESITTVLDVIRGIAEQTNLLALNAAIEAARAGEQGRGFAVVADEVRTLASKTQQSTQEIQQMIEQLQNGSQKAVLVMQSGTSKAGDSVQKAEMANTTLEAITRAVGRIHDMTSQIASAAEEQSAVSEEINSNVVSINDSAGQVTESSAQTATAGSELAKLSTDLQAMMSQFKT